MFDFWQVKKLNIFCQFNICIFKKMENQYTTGHYFYWKKRCVTVMADRELSSNVCLTWNYPDDAKKKQIIELDTQN
jgi:hypothetical protein